MSATANSPPPTNQPNPAGADQPSRSARLLSLVRKLIDYGKELATTLRQRALTEPAIRSRFGTTDIALILATITRALHRASALEARVLRNAARLDAAPLSAPPRGPRAPRPAAPAATEEMDQGPARLPTPAQIAAEARRRPIGAVIADICRELGIRPSDPLWQDVQLAIIHHGGNLAGLVMDMAKRTGEAIAAIWPPGTVLAWPESPVPSPATVCTGPP
jgi:hypothetical protein